MTRPDAAAASGDQRDSACQGLLESSHVNLPQWIIAVRKCVWMIEQEVEATHVQCYSI
jgi:hypothetical protein